MISEKLASAVAVLLALSVASERLVEIIKGFVVHLQRRDPVTNPRGLPERYRRAALHLLAVVAGVVTAKLAGPAIPAEILRTTDDPIGLLAVGLLASGGSGMWNGVLSYVENIRGVPTGALRPSEGVPPPPEHGEPERRGKACAEAPDG